MVGGGGGGGAGGEGERGQWNRGVGGQGGVGGEGGQTDGGREGRRPTTLACERPLHDVTEDGGGGRWGRSAAGWPAVQSSIEGRGGGHAQTAPRVRRGQRRPPAAPPRSRATAEAAAAAAPGWRCGRQRRRPVGGCSCSGRRARARPSRPPTPAASSRRAHRVWRTRSPPSTPASCAAAAARSSTARARSGPALVVWPPRLALPRHSLPPPPARRCAPLVPPGWQPAERYERPAGRPVGQLADAR